MIVKFDGQVPMASAGAKLWDPNVRIASSADSGGESRSDAGFKDSSVRERTMTSVRQEDRYKGKGLGKEMVKRVETECLRRFREEEGRSDFQGERGLASRVKCMTRCVKYLTMGFHGKLGYVAVAEVVVSGMEDSGMRILTL